MSNYINDEIFYDAINLLKEMISVPSVSREESNVAEIIYNFAKTHLSDCDINRINNNIIITNSGYNEEKPSILLNSHIDTVKPVEGWQHDPFSATEEEDKIYGLGSNDAGASVVSLLSAFRILKEKEQNYNLIFAASAEEEVSGKNGMELLVGILPTINFAIVGEPTKMQPATAEKGLMVLDCCVNGVSGHAARNEGVNAIYKSIEYIEKFKNYEFKKVSPILGKVKMSVTGINAGTQHNVIPDKCTFMVDIRPNGMYSNMEILNILKDVMSGCDIKARSTRLNSSYIDKEHPFVKRCEIMGLKAFGSPTLSDQALMPYISVKIGPGDSSRSHTADEYILTSEIREAIELYVKLLDGLKI